MYFFFMSKQQFVVAEKGQRQVFHFECMHNERLIPFFIYGFMSFAINPIMELASKKTFGKNMTAITREKPRSR